jgi:hypothetical protein
MAMKTHTTLFLSFTLIFVGVSASARNAGPGSAKTSNKTAYAATSTHYDRTAIVARLEKKIAAGEALNVHVLVPLCDNENQGIVPTSASLGNGLSLKSNLYWATSKGMKRYFKEHKDWNLISSQLDPNEYVLERVLFERTMSNGTTVRMVIDAYRGDRMKKCLEHYFSSLSGHLKHQNTVENREVSLYGNADLIAFNGHNGLMDTNVDIVKNSDGIQRDAVAIACVSHSWFLPHLEASQGYPLVMTRSLLYPGAPVMEELVSRWAMLQNDELIRQGAGDGYYAMKPKSGVNGARNMFKTGWE